MRKKKEMVYKKCDYGNYRELLYEDTYKDYNYYIMNYGSHPCAYIMIPYNHKYSYTDYNNIDDYIDVHGGFTYSEDHLIIGNNEKNKRLVFRLGLLSFR